MSRQRAILLLIAVLAAAAVIVVLILGLRSGTPVGDLETARLSLERGQPAKALAEIDAWLARHSDGAAPERPAALLMRADALVAAGDVWNALYGYESIIEEYGGTPAHDEAVRKELDLGTRLLRGEIVEPRFGSESKSRETGEELLMRVCERAPGSAECERALLELAQLYEREGNRQAAIVTYEVLIRQFPSGAAGTRAEQRLRELSK
ncbi:MAG: tetratricopeptide repeat protein [Phycisphaerales bacterium]